MNLPSGWFSDEDISHYRELVEKVPIGGTVCELGVWLGRSMCSVADIIKKNKLKVIAVDTFKGTEGYETGRLVKDIDLSKCFQENTASFGIKPKIYQMTSKEASKLIKNETLDLVFIDAEHSYEAVKDDIKNWLPKIKAGGIICGHDYNPSWTGTMKAVDEIGTDSNNTVWYKQL